MLENNDIVIFTALTIGTILIIWHKKRKFDRVRLFGTNEFITFIQKIRGRLFDVLIQGIGYGCLLGGSIILVMEYAAGWMSVVLILALAFMIENDFYRSK